MKCLAVVALGCLLAGPAIAQTPETKPLAVFHLNGNGQLTSDTSEFMFRRLVIKEVSDGYWVRDVFDQRPDGSDWDNGWEVVSRGSKIRCANGHLKNLQKPEVLDGPYSQLLMDGSQRHVGDYVNGKREGKWVIRFDSTGAIADSGLYKRGKKAGIWTYFYANGNPAVEAYYVNDVILGGFRQYWPDGKLRKDLRISGNTMSGVIVTADGQKTTITKTKAIQTPTIINMDQIQKQIDYDSTARKQKISGIVIVRLLIDPQGNYLKHIVIENPHQMLTQAVERELPLLRFTPLIIYGDPSKCWVTIPFNFRLR